MVRKSTGLDRMRIQFSYKSYMSIDSVRQKNSWDNLVCRICFEKSLAIIPIQANLIIIRAEYLLDNEHKTIKPLYISSEFYKIFFHIDKLDMSSCCDKYGFYIHNKLISL